MIYGAINDKDKCHTHLKKVFAAINNEQVKYNWLITDYQCYPENKEIREKFDHDYCWLSGYELTTMIETEDFQWLFAVLTAFPKEISLAQILKYPLPYADMNSSLWKLPLSMQHPLAKIEIVPWDASLVLILSKEKKIIDNFLLGYQNSENLVNYIEKMNELTKNY